MKANEMIKYLTENMSTDFYKQHKIPLSQLSWEIEVEQCDEIIRNKEY